MVKQSIRVTKAAGGKVYEVEFTDAGRRTLLQFSYDFEGLLTSLEAKGSKINMAALLTLISSMNIAKIAKVLQFKTTTKALANLNDFAGIILPTGARVIHITAQNADTPWCHFLISKAPATFLVGSSYSIIIAQGVFIEYELAVFDVDFVIEEHQPQIIVELGQEEIGDRLLLTVEAEMP